MFAGRGLTFIQSLGQEDYNLLLLYMQFHIPSGSGVQEQALCVGEGGEAHPSCVLFIHVCWSSLFCIKSVRACSHRMRNLLHPQICNSVPMCSSVKCEMEAMAGSLPLRDWQ